MNELLKNLQQRLGPHAHLIQGLSAPLLVVMILSMMVLPMPAWLLDTFFTLNIAVALMVMMVAAYMVRPLDFMAFPSVLLAIALSGALGAGILNSLVALTVVFVPQIARVAEAVTTQVRNRDYVDAARASGASAFTIVRVHVLGNVLGPIFVYSTSLISVSMILASGLSFLGLGVKPPEPEWGLMLNTLRTAIYTQPAVAALPGVMIFITSVSFNLLSDGLRSAMDNKGAA